MMTLIDDIRPGEDTAGSGQERRWPETWKKNSRLTDLQKAVLRYRHKGLTLQEIGDIYQTSRANICMIEKHAMRNIRRSRNTMTAYASLDATKICTLEEGSDLIDALVVISGEMEKAGFGIIEDPVLLISRIREENPDRVRGRLVRKPIPIYLRDNGELIF